MISHLSTLVADEKQDKYSLVEGILSATNYYEALGLPDDSSFDEIRRAYIQVYTHIFARQHTLMHACTPCCTHRKVEYAIQTNSYHLIPEQPGVFKVSFMQ